MRKEWQEEIVMEQPKKCWVITTNDVPWCVETCRGNLEATKQACRDAMNKQYGYNTDPTKVNAGTVTRIGPPIFIHDREVPLL